MPRRIESAFALLVVLGLQLALGVLDSSCSASMAGRTMADAPMADSAGCEQPADDDRGSPSGRQPSHDAPAPWICHALAACGTSFVAAETPLLETVEHVVSRIAVIDVATLHSVAFPPDFPPPRA
jgi:hypothetical protein